jgi:hypothetical protein
MRAIRITQVLLSLLAGSFAAHASPLKMSSADIASSMDLISKWIGGNYSTQAQYESDQAGNTPDNEKHRLMFQLFKRVEVPGFDGVLFFEQGSRDGSEDEDMIWRSGLVQVLPDAEAGVLRYRELAFKDQKPWRNAHKSPDIFRSLKPDMVTWDANCDFLLTLSADRTELAGPIPPKACGRKNDGTGQMMYADDRIAVRAGEFGFLGRYVDSEGRHVWGNESDVLNWLVRFAAAP